MINSVVLVGRITKDPELRTVANGSTTVTFTLAVEKPFTSSQGNGQDRGADFITCVCWNAQANFLGQYVKKGYMLGVEGRLSTRTYQNQNGQTVYVTEVACNRVQNLTPRGSSSNSNNNYSNNNNNYSNQPARQNQMPEQNVFEEDIADDELPF